MKIMPLRCDGIALSSKNLHFKGTKNQQKENTPSNKIPLYLLGAFTAGSLALYGTYRLHPEKFPKISPNFKGKTPPDAPKRAFKVTGKEDEIQNELKLSGIARKLGINTPEIADDLSYEISFTEADPKTNPIDKRHFKDALNNILKMDEGEIYHGDLEHAHIFYAPDGKTEFDCFRFGYEFSEKPWEIKREFPSAIYPANATQYENLSLGNYISKIEKEEDKLNFLKDYLQEAGIYHQKRADFLTKSGKGTPEQIKYENLQAELFQNPKDEIVDLFKKRINVQYGHRKMFTDWDEGFGACGHTPDEKRTTDAVKTYFDVVRANIQYVEDIRAQKTMPWANSDNPKIREYLDFEEKYAAHWLDNHSDSIKGMGIWTLNPENAVNKTHGNISEKQRDALEQLFEKFKQTADFDKKQTALQAAEEKYLELLEI